MPRGEDSAAHRRAQQPFERPVARAPEIGRQTRPVQVHVDGQGIGGSVVSQPPLFAADFRHRHPPPAELPGDGHQQIPRGPELLEVFGEEPILRVVTGGSLLEAKQHLVRERECLRHYRNPGIPDRLDGTRLDLCRHASLLVGAHTAWGGARSEIPLHQKAGKAAKPAHPRPPVCS